MFKNMNIKKVSLWLVVIMVGCFVVAGSILMIRGINGTLFTSGSWSGQEKTVDEQKTFDAAGIKNININTVSEDIKVIPSDTDNVRIHYYGNVTGSRTAPELSAGLNGDTLDVELIHQSSFGINIGSSNLKIDVYVPKGYSNSIKVSTVSASLNIEGFTLDSLKYHSVSGDLSSNGIDTKDTILDTTSGRMTIGGFTGNLDFKAVSGDIDVEYKDFNYNIKMHTVSGEMRLDLPENSQFNIDFSSTSGDVNSAVPVTTMGNNDKHTFRGSVGNSSNNISANSVSGDLEIK